MKTGGLLSVPLTLTAYPRQPSFSALPPVTFASVTAVVFTNDNGPRNPIRLNGIRPQFVADATNIPRAYAAQAQPVRSQTTTTFWTDPTQSAWMRRLSCSVLTYIWIGCAMLACRFSKS
ncbi:hypothetical protein L226DRAFT_530638 [Lentinus tigrinus ALCF2SS1-7]|uniref:uncharacterized protein n=1 Tax=Lentinus tigrinus ALCF2SS1-7 TaxID=1328758 RepID=UPI00116618D7|nr:hypothetical protein L226DRAFT_530638 [Lentinus tigrinus ALCF2SS1-7]